MVRTIAEYKLTLIKGHTKANGYDGYGAHHHWELLNMPASEYLSKVNASGLIYPDKSKAHMILSPWQIPWIRENVQLTKTGYDFLTLADAEYRGKDFYAFGDYHDGIDGMPTDLTTGRFIAKVHGGYTNVNGQISTAEIFEVIVDKVIELWETKLGTDALNVLANRGLINDAPKWKKTLDQPIQQWLVWEMFARLLKNMK